MVVLSWSVAEDLCRVIMSNSDFAHIVNSV